LEDWEWVMADKTLITIEDGPESKDKLEMAFGDSSDLRKKWLTS
jgi:hypothetical protein